MPRIRGSRSHRLRCPVPHVHRSRNLPVPLHDSSRGWWHRNVQHCNRDLTTKFLNGGTSSWLDELSNVERTAETRRCGRSWGLGATRAKSPGAVAVDDVLANSAGQRGVSVAIKNLRWLFPLLCQRKDQAAMTETERSRYLCAFSMINRDGTLGQLVDTHAEMHMQHTNARLLPWHRIFLYLFGRCQVE